MILLASIGLGLLAQTASLAAAGTPTPAPIPRRDTPIRVWLSDSSFRPGAPVIVYLRLRADGHTAVLHVDPAGNVRVLFPLSPQDVDLVPGGATFAVPVTLPLEGGTGTVVALRTSTPLRFDGLESADTWDYERALLLQPTAGNPLAALLDIADRIADGERYEFDVAMYRTIGTAAAPRLASRSQPRLIAARSYVPLLQSYAPAPSGDQPVTVIDQSNTVDCSHAVMVNSFCGVVDNRVTTVYESQPQPQTVYVPYYIPFFFPRRRHEPPPQPPPQPAQANLFTWHRVQNIVTPPEPRSPPPMRIPQPYAPSRPRQRADVPVTNGSGVFLVGAAPVAAAQAPVAVQQSAGTGVMVRTLAGGITRFVRPMDAGIPTVLPAAAAVPASSGTLSLPRAQGTFVPSGQVLRAINGRRH